MKLYKMKSKRVPSRERITVEIINRMYTVIPRDMDKVYCLRLGVFPSCWKEAKIDGITKGKNWTGY